MRKNILKCPEYDYDFYTIPLPVKLLFGRKRKITGLDFLGKKLGNMIRLLIHITYIYLEKNNQM